MVIAQSGALSGVIKKAITGEPILEAKITVVSTKSSSLRYVMKSDKKGQFYRGGLQPGMYTITIEKEGYIPMQSSVRVRLEKEELEVELRPFEGMAPTTSKLSSQAVNLLNEGKFEEAIEKFTEVITEDPSNPLFYYYRGMAFERTGDLEKALVDYQKSVELKPDFVLPTSSMGKIYAKQQEFEKAIEFYQKAAELGDQDVLTFYNLGTSLMNIGNQAEAKGIFEKLISLDANFSDAYYHLGIIYIGLGNSAVAIELLQKFIDMDPEHQNASIASEIIKSLKLP
jgi:tetratricopeptide (TPR) repeat protein